MTYFTLRSFAPVIIIAFFSCSPICLIAQQPTSITVGSPVKVYTVEKQMPTVFSIRLIKDKTYVIYLEQKGIDVALLLKTLNGNQIQNKDSPNGSFGPETIEYKADSTAEYHVVVEALNETSNSNEGRFSVQVKETPTFDNNTRISTVLSPSQMVADLRIFKGIRERANSGLYIYRTRNQIDSIYRWANNQVKMPLNILAFYKIIVTLTDFEGSCHNWTELQYPTKYYLSSGRGIFPYHMKYIEGKMTINTPNSDIPLGSSVCTINGRSDRVVLSSLSKYRTTDGYNVTQKKSANVKDRFAQKYQIEFGTEHTFLVNYRSPGSNEILSKTIAGVSATEQERNYQNRNSSKYDSTLDYNLQEKYSFKLLTETIGLLTFRIFTMGDNGNEPSFLAFSNFLDSVFMNLKSTGKIRNLVVDIRGNPGGNGGSLMKAFSYLANRSFKENASAHIIFSKIPFPEYYAWNSSDKENQDREKIELEEKISGQFSVLKDGKYYQDQKFNPVWKPDSNRFAGKLYLLIDEPVGSAASHFASLIRAYSNATIVGVETIGGYYAHNGHIAVEYVLPNSKIKTGFSIVHVEQDAIKLRSQPVGRGVIPDYEVYQSFPDFINNRDTQMQYVLKLINNR